MGCYKVCSHYARMIAKVETLPSRKELINNPPETLIVDVSEQPIERPVKHQRNYYSGKNIRLNLCYDAEDYVCCLRKG